MKKRKGKGKKRRKKEKNDIYPCNNIIIDVSTEDTLHSPPPSEKNLVMSTMTLLENNLERLMMMLLIKLITLLTPNSITEEQLGNADIIEEVLPPIAFP